MINRKPLIISASITFGLILIISFAPALALKYIAKQQMLEMGAEQANIESIYLNLWTGYFKLEGLSATADGKPDLKIGRFETELRYRELWKQRVQISQLVLRDIELHLFQGELWQIGPLTIPEPAPDTEPVEAEPEQPPTQWRGGISGFAFSAVHTSFSSPEMAQRMSIESASMERLYQWTPQRQTQLNLSGHINDSPFVISTQGTPLSAQPKIELQLTIDALALEALTSPWIDGIKGTLSTDLTLQVEQTETGFKLSQSGELGLADFDYQAASLAVSSRQISWNGSAEQQLADAALVQASSNTNLEIEQLSLNQPGLKLQEQLISIAGQINAIGVDRFSYDGELTTGQAQISLPDLELSNTGRSWQGKVEVSLSEQGLQQLVTDGTLKLQQLTLKQPGLDLSETAIEISARTETTPQQVSFDGQLNTGTAEIALEGLRIANQARSWNGSVNLKLSDKGLQQLTTDGSLQLKKLQFSQGDLDLTEDQIDLTGQLATDLKQFSFNGELTTLPSLIQKQHLLLATELRNWKGKLGIDLASGVVTAFSGNFKAGPVLVSHQDGDALISLKQLSLTDINVPETNRFDIGQFQLDDLVVAPKQPLFSLDHLTVSTISTSAKGSSIDTVSLGAIDTQVELDGNKKPHRWLALTNRIAGIDPVDAEGREDETTIEDAQFPILAWFGELTGVKPKPGDAATAGAAEQQTYPFTLNQFALDKPTTIDLIELSAATQRAGKPYHISINTLSLKQVDTTSDQASPFEFQAQANRLGSIKMNGDYTLFAELADANWQGEISGMAMPPFSKMMQSQTGYQIESGKLALDAKGTIRQGYVDSHNELVINNFIVVKASEQSSEEFDGQLGMPLSTAVSLLTDSNDNLNLSIPVSGALSDPKFGIQSAINVVLAKVAREATMGYLSVSLLPYSAVLTLGRVAANAVEGSSITLDPVYFEPGSSEMTEQGVDYLSKIGDLLEERDALRLKLCGQSVAADRQWLREEDPEEPSEEPIEPLTPEEQETLQQLAEARGETVMIYLIEEIGVENDQLFSCLAGVKPTLKEQPHVKLAL